MDGLKVLSNNNPNNYQSLSNDSRQSSLNLFGDKLRWIDSGNSLFCLNTQSTKSKEKMEKGLKFFNPVVLDADRSTVMCSTHQISSKGHAGTSS